MADSTSTSTNDTGSGIIGRVKNSATEQLTNQRNRATDGIGSVTKALRQSTQQLRNEQHETIAKYVDQAADQIDRWCDQVRNKDVSELMGDVQRVARRQPAVFIGSAFALGVLGARFLKSSRQDGDSNRSDEYRSRYGGASALSHAADQRSRAYGATSTSSTSSSGAATGATGSPSSSTDTRSVSVSDVPSVTPGAADAAESARGRGTTGSRARRSTTPSTERS
jgi:hypothetical protein